MKPLHAAHTTRRTLHTQHAPRCTPHTTCSTLHPHTTCRTHHTQHAARCTHNTRCTCNTVHTAHPHTLHTESKKTGWPTQQGTKAGHALALRVARGSLAPGGCWGVFSQPCRTYAHVGSRAQPGNNAHLLPVLTLSEERVLARARLEGSAWCVRMGASPTGKLNLPVGLAQG